MSLCNYSLVHYISTQKIEYRDTTINDSIRDTMNYSINIIYSKSIVYICM